MCCQEVSAYFNFWDVDRRQFTSLDDRGIFLAFGHNAFLGFYDSNGTIVP